MIYWKNAKQSLINVRMAVSIILVFIILIRTFFVHDLFVLGKEMDVLTILTYPFAMSTFVPFACIFPILPYALSYLEEKNSGYYSHIVLRCGIGKYVGNKILFTGLSGGVSLAVPFAVLFIIADIIGQPTSEEYLPYMYMEKIWAPYIFIWGGKLVLIMRLVLIFLFGVLWSEIALCLSLIVCNRYVAFIVPFVIYQILWMLVPGVMNPVGLFRADMDKVGSVTMLTPYLIQVIVITVMIAVNIILMRKRVSDE